MPPRKTTPIHSAAASRVKPHPLHRHRPVVTLAIGLGIILAIGAFALASGRVRNTIFTNGNAAPQGEKITVDTSNWIRFSDPEIAVSFNHPPDWKVTKKKVGTDQFLILSSDKQEGTTTSIYISNSGYLGFEGLPQTEVKVDGAKGVQVSDALLGVKKDDLYYTFDAGLKADSTPIFKEIVKSVQFQ